MFIRMHSDHVSKVCGGENESAIGRPKLEREENIWQRVAADEKEVTSPRMMKTSRAGSPAKGPTHSGASSSSVLKVFVD